MISSKWITNIINIEFRDFKNQLPYQRTGDDCYIYFYLILDIDKKNWMEGIHKCTIAFIRCWIHLIPQSAEKLSPVFISVRNVEVWIKSLTWISNLMCFCSGEKIGIMLESMRGIMIAFKEDRHRAVLGKLEENIHMVEK